MLTEKQRELVENIWRGDCGQLFDYIWEENYDQDISGLSGWVHTDLWTGGKIENEQIAKSVLGSLANEKYIEVNEDLDGNSYTFTQKLADEWGMTRRETVKKYRPTWL